MMKKLFFLIYFGIISLGLYSQQPIIDLTFTAVDRTLHVQLDSIKIMNRTQICDTVLFWPDTVLSIYYVGVPEVNQAQNRFQVLQNYPNPVVGQTNISIYIPEKDKVSIMVTDILGRLILESERVLDRGKNTFKFTPGNAELYFFTARWKGKISSIRILQALLHPGGTANLEYTGCETYFPQLKAVKDFTDFSFNPGDTLIYSGYNGNIQSGMLDAPEESTSYTFQFATNVSCLGTPKVEYAGQIYNTIQIFNQCWLKENLNVGIRIDSHDDMQDNGIIEKYCYQNKPDSCARYGGLYQWDEMMQYTSLQGAQGICPPGWHLPTDEEWKVLEGAVDSQYGIGDQEWDIGLDYRGYDAAKNLKNTSGWNVNGNGSDLYGFSGLPGGYRFNDASFNYIGILGFWWTSTQVQPDFGTWSRYIYCLNQDIFRNSNNSGNRLGFSVRCLRDEIYLANIELTFTALSNVSHVQLDSIKIMNRTNGEDMMLYGSDTTLLLPVEFLFNQGDAFLYIGYIDSLQSGILDIPEDDKTYIFQFATNIPCPETAIIEYEGQVYNTIQVFSQCWLKENLNVGTMIQGSESMTGNGITEKYCYNNEPDSCTKYGGLYQWGEMMQYTTQQGAQGICPPGWHIPTDEEWKVLEGAVDDHYRIGDPEWDNFESDGFDAGTKLKTSSGWILNGNGTNLFGFSGLPGGQRDFNGSFNMVSNSCIWRSSTEYYSNYYSIYHSLIYNLQGVLRMNWLKTAGFSVRCLRD